MMTNSILSPDMKGVMFVSGYRGKGKTFLAAHSDFPQNIAFFDFDEGKAEGLHNQLNFGYYKPVEENEPLKRADMFFSEVENLEQDEYTVAIIDNVSQLEKALQAVVYRDAKRYSKIYGYSIDHILTDNFGKARGITNDLIGDAIAKPLHSKGIKLIIVTSHVKEKFNVPGKMLIQGRDRWQDLSILTLILVEGDNYPVPSAIVQKEALGDMTAIDKALEVDNETMQAIMKGEIPSHTIRRRLPYRLPEATWQAIRRYLFLPANLQNQAEGEKLVLEESEPFSDKLSKEQVAYQLGILEREKKAENEAKAIELMLRQSQEKSIKKYIANNLSDALGPVKVMKLKSAIENGELEYSGEINLNKVNRLSEV
jgi:hypothetical protein